MRLRKKPWIDEAIVEFNAFVYKEPECIETIAQNGWEKMFGRKAPLYVELGTGKGRFITQMALRHPEINFIGIEAQQDVLYYAALKVKELGLTNVRLLVFDVNHIASLFTAGEVNRFFINFCDPWPKVRHAKRRLTHVNFLEKYRNLLAESGELFFKTDNRPLFDFSLEQFKAAKLPVRNVTFDLHQSGMEDNIMTEYEAKFSGLGEKINRCEVVFGDA
ncbi:tRNA (guanosine(46)-N7)-methyltransferase TrmB [Anaerosinus massiliensis]|uniref:tRNA (guanosine(46)-N7)-methyltransferase TrmB n=1 Tax=Massilibacillus massiliensis TaxID=1806837 RepID=UPI000AF2B7E7|nr:tRNA (guanosine(46)-N7)-methyltransferase TrmB [Massilibacillus massiliensis]